MALLAGDALAAVRHVDPSHAAAGDAGEGGAERPYRTLAHAMRQLRPGDTLEIGPGVYRETLAFRGIDWSGGPTVVRARPGAHVLIKGSDVVTGWQRAGDSIFVKRPWTVNSQQVFVDGRALKQIGGTIMGGFPEQPGHAMSKLHAGQGGIWPGRTAGGVRQLTDYSFHYDAAAQSLYVKAPLDTLEGRVVEVSVRPYVATGRRLQDVALRNLRFQHSNTTALNYSGAIALQGNGLVLEGIEMTESDGNGFDIAGDGNVIRASKATYCGQVGMKVRGRGNVVSGNEMSFNNTRGFNKWWEAGGAKFVGEGGLRDSEVSGNRAVGNAGDGLWFDWMNTNNRVFDNVAAYNAGFGIHYEASRRGFIHDNYVFGNRQRGIYLPHSAESVVAHNLVAGNGMEGIAIVDEGGGRSKPELVPRTNRVVGNIIAWNGRAALVLPDGLLGSVSDYNLYLNGDEPLRFSAGWGSRENPQRTGLRDWRSASGQDGHSWVRVFAVPDEVRRALEARRPDPPWREVLAGASRLRVRAADLGAVALAGPAESAPPGPRR
jgi:parallel beta-helix repeat protein